MGYLSALDMREHGEEEVALRWHLGHNHFPPIPYDMIPVAKKAIANAKAGEWGKRVKLPPGVRHRATGQYATTEALVRHMHLDAFLEGGDIE